jgi:hypothetical protein
MTNSTSPASDSVPTLDSLLRGEIAATETYGQAIAKVDDEPEADALRLVRDDHVAAANLLRRLVAGRGGDASTDSGVWGSFAKLVEGSAKAFGLEAALRALREGEEHGTRLYERALESDDVDADARLLIERSLLPRQRSHVSALEQIRAA